MAQESWIANTYRGVVGLCNQLVVVLVVDLEDWRALHVHALSQNRTQDDCGGSQRFDLNHDEGEE